VCVLIGTKQTFAGGIQKQAKEKRKWGKVTKFLEMTKEIVALYEDEYNYGQNGQIFSLGYKK
jgi:hypothetical protein